MLNLMKNIWKGWKRLAHGIITVQNAILLMAVFIFGIGPAAILARLTRQPLLDRGLGAEGDTTDWVAPPKADRNMEWAQRSF